MELTKEYIRRRRLELMYKMSDAEKAAVNNCKQLGYRVIRQQPIVTGRRLYFADLYLPALKLAIEIDGGYHSVEAQKRKDRNRSAGMRRLGYHIVRLTNKDARDVEKVKRKIELVSPVHKKYKNC